MALDADAPRVVEIAGDRVTARSVAQTMLELTGTAGTVSLLDKTVRSFSTTTDAAFPAWQSMRYFVSMFSGQAQLRYVDNDRHSDHDWTSVRCVLAAHLARHGSESPSSAAN